MGCHTECINFFLYIALEKHPAVISSRFWDDLTQGNSNSELLDGCDYPHTYKLLGRECIKRSLLVYLRDTHAFVANLSPAGYISRTIINRVINEKKRPWQKAAGITIGREVKEGNVTKM